MELPNRIYLSPPYLTEADHEAVAAALRSGWVSTVGPEIKAFEQSLEAYAGSGHVVALSSGTAAIHLGLKVLGVQPADVVLVPSLTFAASLNPVLYLGARPCLVDVGPEGNVTVEILEDARRRLATMGLKPKAVVVVHLFGVPADMDAIMEWATLHGVKVLEDAAEALGSLYKGRACGTLGHVGIWSFNGNKIVTTSGGGALWTTSEAEAHQVMKWSTQSREPVAWYEHQEVGYNYRLSNVLAALGRSQLTRLQQMVQKRVEVQAYYASALAPLGFQLPTVPVNCASNCWLPVFMAPKQVEVTELVTALNGAGIEARHVWKPMHRQPYLQGDLAIKLSSYAMAETWFEHGVCLPTGEGMSMQEMAYVVRQIEQFCAN